MELVCLFLQLYLIVIFVRIILSWFPVGDPGSFMAQAQEALWRITEPVLAPVRGIMPTVGVGGMGLDLSPIVVIIGLQILTSALC